MDPNILPILAAAASAILAAISLFRSNSVKTRADEVALLRGEVARLHRQQTEQEQEKEREIDQLRKEIGQLRTENALLYHILRKLGVDVEAEINALRDGAK